MTYAEFRALVHRLERESKQDPAGYERRAFLLSLVGYGFIASILLVLFTLLASLFGVFFFWRWGSIVLILIIPLCLLIGMILRALWVYQPRPQGISLRGRAPQLMHEIKQIQQQINGPTIHEVLLTDDFNANITQLPRLGILGWNKNYLTLGMDLLLTLSPDQFRAVLAHEFGHLSKAHGRSGEWVYTTRARWYRLLDSLRHQEPWSVVLFQRFFNWYAPFYNAYTFVLARKQEYEADQIAAQIAGAEHTAAALIRTYIMGTYLNTYFWSKIWSQVRDQPMPPKSTYRLLAEAVRQGVEEAEAQALLDDAMLRQTTLDNTHPSLNDRLMALGQSSTLPPITQQTAAELMLGTELDALQDELDQKWYLQVFPIWQQRHQELLDKQQQLSKVQNEPSQEQQKWELAQLLHEVDGPMKALPHYDQLLEELPSEHPLYHVVSYQAGMSRLQIHDDQGIEQIEAAIRANFTYIQPGYQIIADYLYQHGRADEAQPYLEVVSNLDSEINKAYEERQTIRNSDQFGPHNLDPQQVSFIKQRFLNHPQIKQVFLVRRKLRYFPNQALHLILLVPHDNNLFTLLNANHQDLLQEFAQYDDINIEHQILLYNNFWRGLLQKLQAIPGAEL
jgi:Zn-dependent protease with chaperone function